MMTAIRVEYGTPMMEMPMKHSIPMMTESIGDVLRVTKD